MQNKYSKEIEKQILEGKLIVILEYSSGLPISTASYCRIIGIEEQEKVVKILINKELDKIPKWLRKIFKIKNI